MKYDKKEWSDQYYQKQVALSGKFSFIKPAPLENNQLDEDGKKVADNDISLINLQNVRFCYDEKKIFHLYLILLFLLM
jgi:hypothetical protein